MSAKWFSAVSEVRVGLLMIAFTFALFFANFGILQTVSLKIFDLNFKLRGPIDSERDVVIVAIDQKSQEELGRWPWSRTVMVDLINRLSQSGAFAIGLDIVFSFPEDRPDKELANSLLKELDSSGAGNENLKRKIEEAAEFADVDTRLARAIKNAGNVVPGYFFFTRPDEVEGFRLDNNADYTIIKKSKYPLTIMPNMPKKATGEYNIRTALGVKPNIKPITKAAAYTGYFNMKADDDGVVRRITHIIKFNRKYFPSLSMQMTRLMAGDPPTAIEFDEFGVVGFQVGELFIPSDEYGRTMLNFYGPETSFQYVPVVDILEGGMTDEELSRIFQDKIVLVGATAIGIGDFRNTPFGMAPGVELHATFIQNVLDDNIMQRAGWFSLFDAGSILGLGLMLTVAMRRLKVFSGALMGLSLAALYIYFQHYMFIEKKMLLDILYPLIAIILVYGGIALYKYAIEAKEKAYVRKAFEQYLSPVIIRQIVEYPGQLKLGGEEVNVTAFFSDIKGFSTFSETMTPTALVDLLNEYLSEMTDIVMDCGGTLDKYQGDALLAFFGAPFRHDDHEIRACRAALMNQKRLTELREKWKSEGKVEIYVRIGLNTGTMLVGNMGSRQRFDYTMMGDEANLAARLEGANKQYGTAIMLSDSTYQPAKKEFEFRELDHIRVVGRSTPVCVYELLEFKGKLTPERAEWLKTYEHAYGLYRLHKFEEAVRVFEKVIEINEDDAASSHLIDRCRSFITNPPDADWDGVFALTQK